MQKLITPQICIALVFAAYDWRVSAVCLCIVIAVLIVHYIKPGESGE